MTIGEDRVRVNFNPTGNLLVAQIKQKSAELIDLCEQMCEQARTDIHGYGRNHFEEAAMWAVKAATA